MNGWAATTAHWNRDPTAAPRPELKSERALENACSDHSKRKQAFEAKNVEYALGSKNKMKNTSRVVLNDLGNIARAEKSALVDFSPVWNVNANVKRANV